MTPQDRKILEALNQVEVGTSYKVAEAAKINTKWPSGTAERHLAKLTQAGLSNKMKSGFLIYWVITDAGRAALRGEEA